MVSSDAMATVKKFLLGKKLMNNQENMSQGIGLQVRDLAASFLEQVVNEFKTTAHTAIRDGDEAIYIDRREPVGTYIKINTWIGQRVPLHRRGKSLLLLSEPKEIQSILHSTKSPCFTERTIDIREFTKHLQNCRKVGCTLDDREVEIEAACVAAPIIGNDCAVVAAMAVSGTIAAACQIARGGRTSQCLVPRHFSTLGLYPDRS